MKKNLMIVLTVILTLTASFALADDGLGVLTAATVTPEATYAPGSAEALAIEAVRKEVPGAVIHYAIQNTDDRRLEWDVFFTDGTMLGECEVDAETYEVRKYRSYEPKGEALTADKAVEKLMASKGALTIIDLDLDRDDGDLWYEGEAELDGRRYEFEMTAAGRIVEWERD